MKNGWQKKRLGELAELRGRIGWRGLTAKEYTESGPLFLSVHSLNYGDYVDYRDAFHISEERYYESPEIILQENDVLICKDGAGIGKVGIVGPLPDKTTINSSLLLIRPGKQLLPKFLYRCLSSPYFQQIVNSRLNGATTPHLYQRDITEFPIVLPPLPEQRRIVAILDEAFEAITTARVNAEKNRQNARELFESYLQSVFTQESQDWPETCLGDVCNFVRGPFGGSLKKSIFVPDGYAVYEQQHAIYDQFDNVRYFIDETKFKEMRRFELLPNDLIMSCSGTMGRVAIVPEGIKRGIINQALLKLTPKKRILKTFLKLWMESMAFQGALKEYSGGAAIQNVASVKILKEIKIPLPSLIEQTQVVEKVHSIYSETQRLESIYQQKIAALDELKQSLLHQAFSGEL